MSFEKYTSASLKRFAENVIWAGGIMGLLIIVFWPISFLLWALTYLYYRSVMTQAALMDKLESIEGLLVKDQSVEEAPLPEAVE